MNNIRCNIDISEKEKLAYREHIEKENPGYIVTFLDINIQYNDVELTATLSPVKFQRIRRITGYLVGTLDRFNNAKRTEVDDRVKHSIGRELRCTK